MERQKDIPFTAVWILSHILTGMVSGAGFLYLVFCIIYRYVYPAEIPGTTYEWHTAHFAAWGSLCVGAFAGGAFGLITALTDLKSMRSDTGRVRSIKYVR